MARASVKSPDAFRTISEAADALDLPQHVLRFWETRFSQIKPMKRSGGRRYYRPTDIALLQGIRHLLYDEGYTIKGVQRILREQGAAHVAGFADKVQPVAAAPSPPIQPQPKPASPIPPAPTRAAQPPAAPQAAPAPAMQPSQPLQSRPDPVRAVLGGRQGTAPSSLRFVPDVEPAAEPVQELQTPAPPLPPLPSATVQPASVEPVALPTTQSAGQPIAQPSAHPPAQQAAQPTSPLPVKPPAPPVSPPYQDAPTTAAQTSTDQRERLIDAYRALADCKQILDQARSSSALTMPAASPATSAQGVQGTQALPQPSSLPAKPAAG
jgi:DNA-binding transcriptional MerR regulator